MSVQRTYARVLVHGFYYEYKYIFIIYLYNNAKIVIEVYEEGNGERASFTSPRLAT